MTDITCNQAQESLTEYALGILPDSDSGVIRAHLLTCASCERELTEFSDIGDRLLDLVPDAEPSLGFDDAVIARVSKPKGFARRQWHSHPLVSRLVVAAAIIAAVVIPVSIADDHHSSKPAELTASLLANTRTVGTVSLSGRPLWIDMSVWGETAPGSITCQLIRKDGRVVTVGKFDVVNGSGSWGAPVAGAASQYRGARILSPTGQVAAQASF